MRIALVGYGRMGRIVETLARRKGHEIGAIVDPAADGATHTAVSAEALDGIEGVIEFSLPEGILDRIRLYAERGLKAVVATTGWGQQEAEARKITQNQSGNAAVLTGSNFSTGAHFLFRLAARASLMANKLPDYDLMIHEYHHRKKVDSPSGTALTLANRVLDHSQRKKRIWTEAVHGKAIGDDELHVSSTRGGSIPGIHSLLIDSDFDSIELVHTARSREGFAGGSILALEWLADRRGYFTADDFYDELFEENL